MPDSLGRFRSSTQGANRHEASTRATAILLTISISIRSTTNSLGAGGSWPKVGPNVGQALLRRVASLGRTDYGAGVTVTGVRSAVPGTRTERQLLPGDANHLEKPIVFERESTITIDTITPARIRGFDTFGQRTALSHVGSSLLKQAVLRAAPVRCLCAAGQILRIASSADPPYPCWQGGYHKRRVLGTQA